MNRRAFVVAALWSAAAIGCSRRPTPLAPTSEARRIVSVTPATTEALFAVGAGERVVGRSRFCDWPPEAASVPIVGGFVDTDLEAILQRAPDLVVGASGPSSSRLAAQLDARGIAFWFPDLASSDAIVAMIQGVGDRTGHGADARREVDRVRAAMDGVQRAVAGLSTPRVLLVLGFAPIVAAGPSSFLDELIGRAQATNVVRAGPPWQTLGAEQVAQFDPDLVLDATVDPGAPSGIDPAGPGWRSVRAVRDGHVAGVNDARVLRPGPRVAEGLAVLARAIHPEAALPHG